MCRGVFPFAIILSAATLGAAEPEPKSARDWLEKATKEYGQRKYADALASLTACLKLDSDNAEALDLRGNAHFMLGKFAESVADFDKFITDETEKWAKVIKFANIKAE